MEALVSRWKTKGYSRNTLTRYVQTLRKLARDIEAIAHCPGIARAIPRVPGKRPRTTIADPTELTALLAQAKPWLRCAILLASHAALRVSDAMQAAPIHYNAEKRVLSLHQKKTGQLVTPPVSNTLAESLDNAPPGDPTTPFLELYARKPVRYHMLTKAWNTLKKRTGANPNLTFHDLRRTIAVSLFEISKDLRVVEQMLGHQSLTSTVQYLEHRDPEKLRPYLEALWRPKGPVQ